jgi:hypothetical protein
MDCRPKLVDLLDYTGQVATLGERAIFRVADYRSVAFYEDELVGRTGIHHDVVEAEEQSWLKIDRLPRRDPPAVPKEINDWISVGRDPTKLPTVEEMRVVSVKVEKAEEMVAAGLAKTEDVQLAIRPNKEIPAEDIRDVVLRLTNDPNAEKAVREYIAGAWKNWAESEKPRRETIRIYESFFILQQRLESQGAERPLELVWGVGVSRWQNPKREIDHPLIEQLVEIEIDTENGAIRIRPRSSEPTLSIKPYQELGIDGANVLQRLAQDHFQRLASSENEFTPFKKTAYEPLLRQAFSLLDPEGQYHPDNLKDVVERRLPAPGPSLIVTYSWVIYARPRSANFIVDDIERLKTSVEKIEPSSLPGAAQRLVSIPDDTARGDLDSLPIELGTGLAQRLHEGPKRLGEESAFYFPKPLTTSKSIL